MGAIIIFLLTLGVVAAVPQGENKIVGGNLATVDQYQYAASLLFNWAFIFYSQSCGGTIITTRAVLSAAHCFVGDPPKRWRIRVGSSLANSGGTVYETAQIIIHSRYDSRTNDFDVAILKTNSYITYGPLVQPASIAGSTYILGDNQPVWAIGWGTTSFQGPASEQLRHVQVWTIDQATCRARYANLDLGVTDNMLCSGWLDVGGRDQCQGDSGGPLLHNNVVVGICSWGAQCALAEYPGVNTRVSKFTRWIQSNV